jgi:prolactin regulatory element-binding protein
MDGGDAPAAGGGKVACAAWIRRREDKSAAAPARVFAAYGRAGAAGSPAALEVLGFDAKECSLSPSPLVRKRPVRLTGSTSSSVNRFAWSGVSRV